MKDFLLFITEGNSDDNLHDSLCDEIWSSRVSPKPILIEGVFKQLMMDVETVRSITNVEGVYLGGELLSKRYDSTSSLDVYIVVDKSWLTKMAYERLMKFAKSHEGEHVFKTTHPLKYHIEVVEGGDSVDEFKSTFPSLYDLLAQKWLKMKPDAEKSVKERVSMFLGRISTAGLDDSARIDWNYFLDVDKEVLPNLKVELQSKLFDIYNELSSENELVKAPLRKFMFGEPPDVSEIEKLYDKEKIPATVISRMVSIHYLYEYIKRIDDRLLKGKDTHKNELPPGGETLNRTDPFPNENVAEGRTRPGFGRFLVEKGLRPLYHPRGMSDHRKSGVSRGLATKSESERMTRKTDDKNKIVVNNGVMHGDVLANEMKKRDFGCVPLTSSQVSDIEIKYGISPLTKKYPFRRLGKTEGMAIVSKQGEGEGNGGVFLIKNKMLDGIGGGVKK